MHMHTYTYIHKHTYIYKRTYTLLFICNYYINYIYQDKPYITFVSHTNIFTYICICTHTYIHKHKHTYIYTCTSTLLFICNYYINYKCQDKPCITFVSRTVIYTYMCVCIYVCMCVDICVCVYVCTCTYMCAVTYIYISYISYVLNSLILCAFGWENVTF